MSGVVRTFLPWYRAGFAAALTERPVAGAARAAVPATVRLRGEPALGSLEVPVSVAGPGDVIGLDAREVLRTEPFDGCPDFEPSYFPYVELASPDLPWRFTPFPPQGQALPDPEHPGTPRQQRRLQPWLALVVVPASRATLRAAAGDGLPVLRCPAAELPTPEQLWAWAHVQVTHDPAEPVEAAAGDPARTLSRLVCPRRLEAGVRYLACLTPTFAAGRVAGVGGDAGADPLAPAWGGTGSVELPVYYSWSFQTGAEGSFEALVRRLRPRPAPASLAGREIGVGAPGWGAAADDPDATTLMQGALRPIGTAEPPAGDGGLAGSLRTAVSRSGSGVELRPPLYGQDYQGGIAALAPDSAGWLTELNTDPRRRTAAGLASWAVAVHQEELADRAWRQLRDAGLGAPGRADPELADLVTGAVAGRHGGGAALTRAELAGVAASARAAAAAAPERLFAPRFDEPAYTLLRAVAEEWLLPAAGDLPDDTVLLVRTNTAFVESFLVGLNHALARELVWRRFPLDQTATFFSRFWAGGSDLTAVPPIASWDADDELGGHGSGADHLVLLVKGALLRRFPTAALYLSRARGDGGEERLMPYLSGAIGTGSTFLGFALTPEQAAIPGQAWHVVVEEAAAHARFGCDDPPPEGPAPLHHWSDLDWSHPHLAGQLHMPVPGPLAGLARTLAPGAASAVWALDSANVAVIVQQPAFRVRLPIALWLEPQLSSTAQD
ncbi:hypothetical protein GCM10022251_30520 [Phytohabitans flavus]|uniref:Uncharacterized protein n=1 Tax=Phytohabitans flavus TaxID=1076124 RepID=A0A6F8XX28_9ACTN|nr:hypothetical protein [Phytohabitans flavus]BCB78363.1 hypothetical protein Pflav_047730 [Phytohabitans flavus]